MIFLSLCLCIILAQIRGYAKPSQNLASPGLTVQKKRAGEAADHHASREHRIGFPCVTSSNYSALSFADDELNRMLLMPTQDTHATRFIALLRLAEPRDREGIKFYFTIRGRLFSQP
jgi:hypothetical protein